jgi:hypothetical protein
MPGRSARQCRERWCNYINPDIQKTPWSAEDDLLLKEKVSELGTRWHAILSFFPGRSKNQVRNRWFTIERRLAKISGVTPHKPERLERAPLPELLATDQAPDPFWDVLGFHFL